MGNFVSNEAKREKKEMPKSTFIMVICIIRNLYQDVDYLSEKSDKELCEIRNKNPRNNIIYFIRDEQYEGHTIAQGILKSRHPSLVEFCNETLRKAVELYPYHEIEAEEQYGPIACWDVSSVTNMYGLFMGNTVFNADLSQWDVSNVIIMKETFSGCMSFDADLSAWDVSNVINMEDMFTACLSMKKMNKLPEWYKQ